MRIGLDIMGGDYAPKTTVGGAVLAFRELPASVRLVLIGDRDKIVPLLKEHNAGEENFDIIHTTEVIEMSESPLRAISAKPNSSIGLGFQLLKSKDLDAFASNGSTGAMMVGALYSVKTIEGLQRPCIATIVPKEDGGVGILLDVGSNADCRPEVLCQFAVLGKMFSKYVYNIEDPKVALLNIGEEEEKGNLVAQAAHEMMKEMKNINFVGNIEARYLFDAGSADVVVCEGFVGNVVLKEAEAFYKLMKKRKISDPFFDRFNYEIYGGTPFLGVNSTVVIGHGISNEIATKNMILLTKNMAEAGLAEKIKKAFNP
ncbi:MAG TPA: phosphate acyltransferase PlsX [Bacteroidia bacterium]|nr:phosphate acyltransferase PlsX [Bacteroidia bacterium]